MTPVRSHASLAAPVDPRERSYESSLMTNLEEHQEGTIRFIGEQDGKPERALKSELQAVLTNASSVQKAYLARVLYGDSKHTNVALCLYDSAPSSKTADSCADAFQKMFRRTEALDIVFLDSSQEAELSKVCRPFFFTQISQRD